MGCKLSKLEESDLDNDNDNDNDFIEKKVEILDGNLHRNLIKSEKNRNVYDVYNPGKILGSG